MDDVEVRELRYFRAVAEELNFSRAAERLGMAQPPLSRAIRLLERRLGVQLFERTSRHVALTPAGNVLFVESAKALDAVAAAVRRTRRAVQRTPALVVTAKPGVATDLLRRIADAHPDPVEIRVSGFGEQADLLRDGQADVAVLGCPGDHDGLDVEVLVSEPRVAALPSGHELARRSVLTCADFAGRATPVWPGSSAAARAYWSGQDVTGGPVTPGPVVRDSAQLLETVALGQAIALLPASVADLRSRNDVVYRPVVDATPYALALAWAATARDVRIARFVRTAVEISEARPRPGAVPAG
ncbi:LysR family transcriptional regulator [Amycolatopsis sp. SID8362]|uniref:LysR family transcriptional regulator n=1 Tax=Amycolatopsis sp. SID8362 TaxID=2690346 RepID=UPI00136CF977|nr:LysR family transcriptional regulator [Amycolatopsis sp. SID8362]NBH09208.1 LysR family transcriptional regulator [Amycolatopsis sp. SID8362]NED45901.1 LysR family transcriptional regulator [Amycolatopsis sp. SID8362]